MDEKYGVRVWGTSNSWGNFGDIAAGDARPDANSGLKRSRTIAAWDLTLERSDNALT
jgi:hypothetical protein